MCRWGSEQHYILECPAYTDARTKLLGAVHHVLLTDDFLSKQAHQKPSYLLKILLEGSNRLSVASNQTIFAEIEMSF